MAVALFPANGRFGANGNRHTTTTPRSAAHNGRHQRIRPGGDHRLAEVQPAAVDLNMSGAVKRVCPR